MKAFILFLLVSFNLKAALPIQWKKIKNLRNVDVYSGDIPNSPVVAFRGVADLNAPFLNVVSVIHDETRMKEWMSDLAETKILSRSGDFDKTEYNRTKAPWPLSDRDFVYTVKVVVNKEEHSVDILIENTTHPDAPEKNGVVRGSLSFSRYLIKSLEGGKKAHLEVEILADPKGSIPKWVVNLFQSNWPSNTISGIGKIASEPNYKVHPTIANYVKTAIPDVAK